MDDLSDKQTSPYPEAKKRSLKERKSLKISIEKTKLLSAVENCDDIDGYNHQYNSSQGSICQQCTSIFSTPKALKTLLSQEGLQFSLPTMRRNSEQFCSSCRVLDNAFPSDEERPWFRNHTTYRLKAVCRTELSYDSDPFSPSNLAHDSMSDHHEYPLEILDILRLTISTMHPGSEISHGGFLEIYQPLSGTSDCPLKCSQLATELTCDRYMEVAKEKLQECLETHLEYGCQTAPPALPTRVIDIGLLGLRNFSRLHIADLDEKDHYAALSYCWGGPQPMTTEAVYAALQHMIEPNSMSQTVQDAITVTRKLGIRYLWVDALCIIQDSDSDKVNEIREMGNIYKNATVTIVAQSGSAHAGFPINKPRKGCELPFCLPDGTLKNIIAVPDYWESHSDLPVDSRAWTFQEYILSQRVLEFRESEIHWHCALSPRAKIAPIPRSHSDEAFPALYPRLPSAPLYRYQAQPNIWEGRDAQQISWERIAQRFSERQLSFPEDRLPAIAGITQELENFWSDICIVGFWPKYLALHLFWRTQGIRSWDRVYLDGKYSTDELDDIYSRGDRNYLSELPKVRFTTYIAPTWSWLSVQDKVLFTTHIPTAQVIDCVVEPRDANFRLGALKDGKVVLRTKLLYAPHRDPTIGEFFDEEDGPLEQRCGLVYAKLGVQDWIPGARRSNPKGVTMVVGLILSSAHIPGYYKRIGAFKPQNQGGDIESPYYYLWAAAKEKAITII